LRSKEIVGISLLIVSATISLRRSMDSTAAPDRAMPANADLQLAIGSGGGDFERQAACAR
jgi:hypothetical protein